MPSRREARELQRKQEKLDHWLWNALRHGDVSEVSAALTTGANVEALEPEKEVTPIFGAASAGHKKLCEVLLLHGHLHGRDMCPQQCS